MPQTNLILQLPQDTANIEIRLRRATEIAEHEGEETAKNSTTNMSFSNNTTARLNNLSGVSDTSLKSQCQQSPDPFGAGTFPNKEQKSSGFADQFSNTSSSPNLSAQQRTHPQQFNAQQQFNVQRPPQQMFTTQGPSQLQFNIQGSNTQGSPPSGAVLLIGSTGNGKSVLGNFLFEPKFDNKQHFEVGKENLPKTQTCKTVTQRVKYHVSEDVTSLTIIDTPGFNENRNNLEQMIDLVTQWWI